MLSTPRSPRPPAMLAFVRHGATEPNLAGLRCGGDLDVPLIDAGRRQAAKVASRIGALGLDIGLVVSSDLQRTRETAAIVSQALGGLEVRVEPGFNERRLGTWNLQSIALTEAWLRAGLTPPGGEADSEFLARIGQTLARLGPLMARRPLLVGSRGVARILGELVGRPGRLTLKNGEVADFDLAAILEPTVTPAAP